MKRLFSAILVLVFVIVSAFGLTSCKESKHKVDFISDGKVYSSVETNGNERIKMPEDPEKEGYSFEGWYRDEGSDSELFYANSLLDTKLEEDLSVNAKWASEDESSNTKSSEHYVYPMETITKLDGAIKDNVNQYKIESGRIGAVVDLSTLDYNTVTLTKGASALSLCYTFLQELPVADEIPVYASGYAKLVWDDNDSATVTIPSDARYLYVFYNSNALVYVPDKIEFFNTATSEKECPRSFNIATWNIGHFSNGKLKNSEIKDANYKEKSEEYRKYINELNADLICFNEYSELFTSSNATKKALFKTEPQVCLEGAQYNYSCNAVFSGLPLKNVCVHAFECNKTATITHTTAIKAPDYYYITGQLTVDGETVDLVFTHLAFDDNLEPDTVCINQMNELISKFADSKHVVMMGDWNAYSYSYFDRFKDAGYTVGNTNGKIKTCTGSKTGGLEWAVDNIIVKGLQISNFHSVDTKLSDHVAVVATISLPK